MQWFKSSSEFANEGCQLERKKGRFVGGASHDNGISWAGEMVPRAYGQLVVVGNVCWE